MNVIGLIASGSPQHAGLAARLNDDVCQRIVFAADAPTEALLSRGADALVVDRSALRFVPRRSSA